jgi:dTDP-4-amino-4,6-dideoxygalactose transaminase
MNKSLTPFKEPVYVTRPLLPNLSHFTDKLAEIWDARWLTNDGPQHKMLENKLSEYLRVPHLSLFNNGTIALIVACQSLRLSGEVITTPFTFPATPHVLSWNGIRPVFCDIDPETMNIDSSRIESMITPQTTAILGVHVFGTPCDVFGIQEIADRYGLRVVYDAAHAFGVEIEERGIGTFGDVSMFSFHATKLFHTAEGGALTYNNLNQKQRVDLLKNFGIKNQEEVMMPGINGKMNELQAALGLVMLDYLEAERSKRKEIQELYHKLLSKIEGISFYESDRSALKLSYQYFVIRVDAAKFGMSRNELFDELKKYNIYSRKYFHPLCSEYACYRHIPSANNANLPVANKIASEVLALPYYGGLSLDDVEKICEIISDVRFAVGQYV